MFRRPLGPGTVRSPSSAGANATGNGDQERARSTTYTNARLLGASTLPGISRPRRVDKNVVRKEPAGPGALVMVRKEPAGPGALVVVGLHVTTGQGLPGSRKAWRAGPVPVWHSRVVSGARASARAGNVLPQSRMAMPGGLRRSGFGPGWERFAYPSPPSPPSPFPSPRTRIPP